jgi:ribosomal protein S18 acetylase RimI-like enzyme
VAGEAGVNGLAIVPFRREHAADFRRLNLEWIERFFKIEAPDLELLDDPWSAVIESGGMIFIAQDGEEVVGTAAMIRVADDRYELAKMAVAATHRRCGVGEALGRECIAWAAARGARTIFLETNSALGNAIRLYERLGFHRAPRRRMSDYARGDVYMEMKIEPDRS